MKKVLAVLWIMSSVISFSAARESSEVKEIINNKVIEDFGKSGLFDEVRNGTFSEKEKRILKNYYYSFLLENLDEEKMNVNPDSVKKYRNLAIAEDKDGKYEETAYELFIYDGLLGAAGGDMKYYKWMASYMEEFYKEYPFLINYSLVKPNIYTIYEKNLDEALRLYTQMETGYPIPELKNFYLFMAYSGKSMVYLQKGDYEKSLSEFYKLTEITDYLKDDGSMALYSYSYTNLNKEKPKKAQEFYNKLKKSGYELYLLDDETLNEIKDGFDLIYKINN